MFADIEISSSHTFKKSNRITGIILFIANVPGKNMYIDM